ncbi:hypothetical protein [Alkalihalobacillus trypoxylicola]|uniref:Uncharacterized protein n=1 Tax=Alkalihalobacillus trypoxylicola TaxID=519424 RepID=A0A161PB94_9BACI|nr:hypothetical protein [Alkalihalobacillus trypoxylicola]KYG29502.1 hypothetical protein AZF04_08250 [Alkalihalobacillus trypoxylicola]
MKFKTVKTLLILMFFVLYIRLFSWFYNTWDIFSKEHNFFSLIFAIVFAVLSYVLAKLSVSFVITTIKEGRDI